MANNSLCALPGKRQWFIVVTRSRPDGTFQVGNSAEYFVFNIFCPPMECII